MTAPNRTTGLICTALLTMALAAQAGIVMRSTVKSDGRDEAANMQNLSMTTSIEGKGLRIDYVESKNPTFKKGDYMLCNDGGKTFYIVQTRDKTYAKFDLALLGGMMGMMNMKLSDAKTELLVDEAGPELLGYPTRHTKTRMSYTMEMSFMGMKQKNQTVNDTEMWATTKIDSSVFVAWFKGYSGKSGNAEMDALMEACLKNVKGVPLKQISTSVMTDSGGKKTTQTLTTEVTEIKEQSLPAKLFEIPADYKDLTAAAPPENSEDKSGGEKGSGGAPGKTPSLTDMLKMMSQ